MSALTTRVALERILQDVADARCLNHGPDYGGCVDCSPAVEEMVDALLDSGVVVDAATLADDDALLDGVERRINEGGWPGGTPRELAATLTRVVSAALSERSPR